MTFQTTDKPITHYQDTPGIRRFAQAVGDYCQNLTQAERYQLCLCMSVYCCVQCDLTEDDHYQDLLDAYHGSVPFLSTGNVMACLILLEDETPDAIAALFPAIARYAENPLEAEFEDGEMYNGECVLPGMGAILRRDE